MNRLTLRSALPALLLSISLLGLMRAEAQSTSTGTVTGTVADPTGALIPEATITLTDTVNNVRRTTTTNKAGQFILVDVPPSTYSISAAKAGFVTDLIVGQTVEVGTQTTDNFRLAIGAETTTVEVQATNADLQTLNATIGVTVNPLEIDSLPSVARDVSTFATLQPGVTPGGSVAGTVADQAVFQLDGGNNSSDMDGSMLSYTGAFGGNTTGLSSIGAGASGVMPMPQDSIEEFKVATAGQTADFDNSSGSQVQVVTKRGTNKWKGSVYEYYLDSNIGANTWQNDLRSAARPNGVPKPSNHYSRFGVAAGGPIAPYVLGGKTYFFANFEGFRFPNSATYERSVPSADMRNGIVHFGGTTYNLNTLDPRGIGIDPVVQQFWNKYEPVGNDTSCAGISGARCDGVNTIGYTANVTIPQKSNFLVGRMDHDFGAKWHFNTSYRYFKLTKATTNQVDIGGAFAGDKIGAPTALANRPQDPWYYVAGLTTNINSSTTNDFHYSYLRNIWSWQDGGAPTTSTGLGGRARAIR